VEVRLKRCEETVERCAWVYGHEQTVAPHDAQWQSIGPGEEARTVSGVIEPDGWRARGAQYEYRVLTITGATSRAEARRLLTDEAEYGRWELARTRMFTGGERKVWLRRKIIRMHSTL
jgi:phage protein U